MHELDCEVKATIKLNGQQRIAQQEARQLNVVVVVELDDLQDALSKM